MSSATFHPGRLHGSAALPPAKSEAHRALLLAALGRGECRLHGFTPPLCEDTQAMIRGITALGATVQAEGDTLLVTPTQASGKDAAPAAFHVGACAAALRMLIPAFWARGQAAEITMEDGLFARPLDAFAPLAKQIGGQLSLAPAGNGEPPSLRLSGRMHAGSYQVEGALSSQYASGLLIALAHATDEAGKPAPSRLSITRPIVSRPYLDMTLAQMKRFGACYAEEAEGCFTLSPSQAKNPSDVDVAGDWSQAAVLLCANAMGSGVMLRGMGARNETSLQGDAEILPVLRRMGLSAYETQGELYVTNPSRPGLMPMQIDCTDIPDIAPILALTCTQARGVSTLTGVKRLKAKECDRLRATREILTRLGAVVTLSQDEDALTVEGPAKLKGNLTEDARGDHRMVMLLAVAALRADGPVTVTGVESLGKSWPGFLDTWKALGGEIT